MAPFFIVRTFSTPLSPSCLEPQDPLFDKCVVNTHYTEGPILEARQGGTMRKTRGLTSESLARKTPTRLTRETPMKCRGELRGQSWEGKGIRVTCPIRSEDHRSRKGSERFSAPTSHFPNEKSESPGKVVLCNKPRTYPGSLTRQAHPWHNRSSEDAVIRAYR